MKLSVARAIHKQAQVTPLIRIYDEKGDKFGRLASVQFNGDHQGFFLQGNPEGTRWWIAHFVYGGCYAEGATKKEAAVNFAEKRLPWLKKRAQERALAAKIVAQYGE